MSETESKRLHRPKRPARRAAEPPEQAASPAASPRRAKRRVPPELPSSTQLQAELQRERHRQLYGRTLRSTVYTLIVVAAVAVLVAVMVMPVLKIYGSSMNPTLVDGDIVLTVKTSDFDHGDLVCFYYGNKLLVKRYIAGPGQWVDIDESGNVYVDGALLDEPYLAEKSLGECDIDLPCQVPDGRLFVLGDHRSTSVDSRSSAVGYVSGEQLVGKIVFRIWPLAGFGPVN